MTQIINDKLKKICENCREKCNKPCAWISLGNEYCDDIMEAQQEIERLNNGIERINSIYRSMQFSAPENQYIFINQLGEVLKELKGSGKE